MAGERDVAAVIVHAEVVGIRKRVFLGVEPAARDLLDELLDVHRDRLEAKRSEHFRVQLAHLAADVQALAVRGRADRPHLVGEVPKPVVPEAEQAVRSALAHPAADQVAKAARERRGDCLAVLHYEGQLSSLSSVTHFAKRTVDK